MIFDNVKNCKMYCCINPKFEKAFEFIQKVMHENTETGTYEIDGKDVYAVVQEYETKLKENTSFESHEKYIDIQCVIEGCETLGCIEASKAVIKTEYNDEKDVAFYQDSDAASFCVAQEGDFCVFYPHDIHCPGGVVNNLPSSVKKIVVKVRV